MEIHLIIGFVLSAVIGIVLGLVGGGGSIIAIPILVYFIGVEVHQAINMSLAIIGVTSLISAGLHNQRGTVKLKTAALFSILGMPGAYFGSRLRYLLSPDILLFSFAALKAIIGIFILVRKDTFHIATIHQNQSKFKALLTDSIIGLLTGFLGVGGGFMVIPALRIFYGFSLRDAIGTSLLIVAAHCGVGLISHLYYGSFDFRMTMLITMIAIDGTLIGTALSYRISPSGMRKWFGVFITAVSVFLIIKNYLNFF